MAEYIEREKALKLIDQIFDLTDPEGEEQIGVLKCRAAIREAIPDAGVAKVRHGEWITYENGAVICSECNDGEKWKEFRLTYCPYCGAKMDL